MPIYELHEITELGDSANIDLTNTQSTTFKSYSTTDRGIIVIDKNIDLNSSRKIINLNVKKTSQTKFNQIIGIDFEDFIDNANDPTKFLESKIQSLEQSQAKLLAASNIDKDLIRKLQEEIDNLRKQLELIKGVSTTNKVPDTLKAREELYADRQGRATDPGYPKIQNKLLSKNRKAIAIIQEDGKFVVYTGNFDEFGNEIRNVMQVDQFGNNILEPSALTALFETDASVENGKTPGVKFQISNGNGNLIVFRLGDRSTWQALTNETATLSYASKLVLDDDGILTLYDGSLEKWSTKSIDPPKQSTAQTGRILPSAINKISDSLVAGNTLYSDRTGRIGATGTRIENKLLSRNRKAIAVIQPDGNFAVYTGNFDEYGDPIPRDAEVTVKSAFGYNTDIKSPAAVKVYVDTDNGVGQLEVFRLEPSPGTNPRSFESGRQLLSNDAKLVLTDDGKLTLVTGIRSSVQILSDLLLPGDVVKRKWSTDSPNWRSKDNPLQPGRKVKLP